MDKVGGSTSKAAIKQVAQVCPSSRWQGVCSHQASGTGVSIKQVAHLWVNAVPVYTEIKQTLRKCTLSAADMCVLQVYTEIK